MRTTCPVVPPVCYAAKRNPWLAQNIHATNFLCSIELICLICWLKIVMIIHVSFCTTDWSSECGLQCSQDCLREGFEKLTIILYQDSTDKKKIKSQWKFNLINAQISEKIVVDFIHTPTYSPNFNLVK